MQCLSSKNVMTPASQGCCMASMKQPYKAHGLSSQVHVTVKPVFKDHSQRCSSKQFHVSGARQRFCSSSQVHMQVVKIPP